MRYFRILCVLCTVVVTGNGRMALAQSAGNDPTLMPGLEPFASYHGGNIDTVNLWNGGANVDIPLISYPQRGGKLKLEFVLHYFNYGGQVSWFCVDTGCYPSGFGALLHGFDVLDTQMLHGLAGATNFDYSYNPPKVTAIGATVYTTTHSLVNDTTGVYHPAVLTASSSSGATFESIDATGFQVKAVGPLAYGSYCGGGCYEYTGGVFVIDPDGIQHTGLNSPTSTTGPSRADTNGNRIGVTFNSIAGAPVQYSWTDSLGRVIPTPSTTTDFDHCTGPYPIASAWIWNLPGVSGGTYPIKFCYVQVTEINPVGGNTGNPYSYAGTELQSVVLPNNTAWTFLYSTDGTGYNFDLSQVIFPTGGTLSYTWYPADLADPTNELDYCDLRSVATRTLNPNDVVTSSATWTYAYAMTSCGFANSPSGTIVSSPPSSGSTPDDAVHIFTLLGNGVNPYETQTGFYQGSHTNGPLLKTVNRQYSYTPYSSDLYYDGILSNETMNVVPIQTTTTLNNAQTKTTLVYDTALTYYCGEVTSSLTPISCPHTAGSYGRLPNQYQYDYGSGAPGALLRTSTTAYLAFNNSSYLNANLLDLPSSVQVTGSGPGTYTTYSYDENNGSPQGALGNLTSVHRWLNTTNNYLVTNNVYNSNGLLTSSTDPRLLPTSYGYSGSYAGSGPTSVTNALGQTTNYAYDFNTGLLTSVTDPNSRTTSYAYDNMLRTTQINYPDGGQSTLSYPNPNEVDITEKISASANRLSSLLVDGVGRKIRQATTNGEPNKPYDEADTCYDGLGRISFTSYPFQDSGPFATSRTCASPELGDSFAHDALSRTLSVSHSDANSVISISYSGNTTTVTDEQARTRESFVDGLGRLTQVIENPGGLNYATNYTFDALDNLTSVVQNGSRSRTFAYDSLSRLTSSTNPESNWSPASLTSVATTYSYDADGNLVNKIEPAQNQQSTSLVTLTYCYDALNRMTAKGYTSQTCSGGTMPNPVATYAYDGNAPVGCSVGSFSYGLAIGRRTAMCDAAGSEGWAYNIVSGVGWQTTDQRTTNGITKTSVYQGDLLGSPLSIQYPSGRTIDYTPNAADRPTSATDAGSGLNYASSAHYAANGTQCWAVLGGVTTVSETLNSRLQPNQMQATNSSVGYSSGCPGLGQTGNLFDLSYNFNLGSGDNGNVMGIVNNRDTTRSQAFMYDPLNRLSQATASTHAVSPAHCWGESYQYDNQTSGGAWGNLTAIGVASSSYNGCTQESLSLSADTNNRINSSGYGYDTAGNMIVAPPTGSGYTFNAENQMAQAVTFSGTTGYLYDGDGRRVAKTTSGTPFKLYWYDLGGNVLDETDATGSTSNGNFNEYIFFGGKRIARRND